MNHLSLAPDNMFNNILGSKTVNDNTNEIKFNKFKNLMSIMGGLRPAEDMYWDEYGNPLYDKNEDSE